MLQGAADVRTTWTSTRSGACRPIPTLQRRLFSCRSLSAHNDLDNLQVLQCCPLQTMAEPVACVHRHTVFMPSR